jgi:hypothetical protein
MQKQPDEFLDVVSEQVAKINYAKNLDYKKTEKK